MNPGLRISSFIESYTGISNAMLQDAPPVAQVMKDFSMFMGDHNLVAHNAAFDKRFLRAELKRINTLSHNPFSCSLLAARRLYQLAPNHTLGGLVEFKNIPTDGIFHRALADAEMTAKLWLAMLDDIAHLYQVKDFSFTLMQQFTGVPRHLVPAFFRKLMAAQAAHH